MKVSDRCYAVTGLGYSPPWSVNAGFIIGDHTTLVVDTGANTLSGATVHGYATAVRPGNALRVVNTEKHFDHILGNVLFTSVGCGSPTMRVCAGRPKSSRRSGPASTRRSLTQLGACAGKRRSSLPERSSRSPMSRSKRNWTGISAAALLVLFTPGHTETNICVWVPSERVLYAGDCLINGYLPNLDAGTSEDWEIWLRSLDRIERLHPLAVVCGHGPVAEGEQVARIICDVRDVLVAAIASERSPASSGG